MSITKSYNKQTDTYYTYETTYEWSDEKQKRVQRKRCIGKFDPDTGMVIPNGKVERPSHPKQAGVPAKSAASEKKTHCIQPGDAEKLTARLTKIEEKPYRPFPRKYMPSVQKSIHLLHGTVRV